MKLNLLERFTILKILPQEGNFATLKILNNLKSVLSPSEEEFKEFEIKPHVVDGKQTDKIVWNAKGQEEREIEIGEKATDIIIESLKDLDKSKKLINEHFSIYEKFVKE